MVAREKEGKAGALVVADVREAKVEAGVTETETVTVTETAIGAIGATGTVIGTAIEIAASAAVVATARIPGTKGIITMTMRAGANTVAATRSAIQERAAHSAGHAAAARPHLRC